MYVRMDCSSKNLALCIYSQAHVVLGTLRMRDADSVLLDDRALVQVTCYIVRRCSVSFTPRSNACL